jgi:hypothetical protein
MQLVGFEPAILFRPKLHECQCTLIAFNSSQTRMLTMLIQRFRYTKNARGSLPNWSAGTFEQPGCPWSLMGPAICLVENFLMHATVLRILLVEELIFFWHFLSLTVIKLWILSLDDILGRFWISTLMCSRKLWLLRKSPWRWDPQRRVKAAVKTEEGCNELKIHS